MNDKKCKFSGFGLVTESCPAGSVGCRIRISKDAVDFYEYSALYDRNQYVCVHKTEFDEAKESGCLKKKNGRVRCWCHGRSNCNTAEASKTLYEAFVTEDKDYFKKVIREIDSSPTVPIVRKNNNRNKNNGGMLRGGNGNENSGTKNSASGSMLMGEDDASPFVVRQPGSRKVDGQKVPSDGVKDIEGESVFSKSSPGNEHHKLRHHHYRADQEKDQSSATSRGSFSNKDPEEVQRQSILVGNDFLATLRPTIKTTTKVTTTEIPNSKTKIIHDKNSDIHVITVGAQDQYDLQNTDQSIIPQPRTLPTDITSDDLYDEEELAKLDAEYAEQQKRQNRPIPAPESIQQAIRILPQEDEDVTEDGPDPEGEYFDSNSSAVVSFHCLSSIRILLISLIFIRRVL
uniref:Uncharacterized protein n=1 Tax=Panagrolaimus superbus TaxID=310955 RepID=A0A914YS07_9BILA